MTKLDLLIRVQIIILNWNTKRHSYAVHTVYSSWTCIKFYIYRVIYKGCIYLHLSLLTCVSVGIILYLASPYKTFSSFRARSWPDFQDVEKVETCEMICWWSKDRLLWCMHSTKAAWSQGCGIVSQIKGANSPVPTNPNLALTSPLYHSTLS